MPRYKRKPGIRSHRRKRASGCRAKAKNEDRPCPQPRSVTSRSIMRSRDKVSRYYSRRRRGGRATPGKSAWCRFYRSATGRLFSTAAAPVTAASRTDGYTIAQFAKDCAGLLGHLKIARCHAVGFALGGQIVQALAIDRPDLVATLTIAAAGAGMKATSGAPREVRNTDEEEIRAHGFEAFIRGHIENTHMAFNAEFYRDHPDVVKALSDALWQRQTSPEQHRYHFDARRSWIPWQCAEGQGADADPLRRGRRRQSRRQHAGRHGAQTRRIGSRRRACARAQCKAYDFLGRRRRTCGVAGLSRAPSNSVTNETSAVGTNSEERAAHET